MRKTTMGLFNSFTFQTNDARSLRCPIVNRATFVALLLLGALLCPLSVIAEGTASDAPNISVTAPMEDVRQTLDLVVATNERLIGEDKTKERRDALRKIIEPRFNFNEMAKRSLGPEWSKRSKEEQDEFADTFAKLLASTYLDRVETATRGMITVDKEKVQFPRAIVRTTVASRGETFPIDYKLQYSDGAWRVYDVVIENIGLVANYRSEFAGIIRKEEFSGLMKKLREKAA